MGGGEGVGGVVGGVAVRVVFQKLFVGSGAKMLPRAVSQELSVRFG